MEKREAEELDWKYGAPICGSVPLMCYSLVRFGFRVRCAMCMRDLQEMCESKPGGYFVFTSNVDSQFQKAGFREGEEDDCDVFFFSICVFDITSHHVACTPIFAYTRALQIASLKPTEPCLTSSACATAPGMATGYGATKTS